MRPTNLETGAEDDVPPDSFWAEVVEGMRLTPAQVGEQSTSDARGGRRCRGEDPLEDSTCWKWKKHRWPTAG